MVAIDGSDAVAFCREMLRKFDLQIVCVTRGANGSLLFDGTSAREHAGFRADIKDTVGAGDAFTSALVHGLLHKMPLAEINDLANRMGAWVASGSGAMPPVPEDGLLSILSQI